ncbi:hypothetical protein [Phycisphaera mikurensis]|uniref:hypothetical protein n=1 Tax=Phycisphaera mikurensis TaxID=547188 RepID=UPI0012B5352E|nr:hypothetical protein [Phycisphaera mikurensis]MBB6440513.1 hypothetical protein [Phycisphaera mikurensis]
MPSASAEPAEPLRRGEAARRRRERFERAWAPLVRAIDAAGLYDAEHPTVRDRLAEAAEALGHALATLPCTLLVEPAAIVPVAGGEAGVAATAEARLAGLLHGRDAAAIRFTALPGPGDVRALAEGVAAWRPGRPWSQTLGRVVEASDGRVSVEPMNFAGLAAGFGRGRGGPAGWSTLLDCLLGGGAAGDAAAAGGGSAAVRDAAEAVATRMRADPQVGAELLRRRLAEAGATMSGADAVADAATVQRMQDFATELGKLLGPDAEASDAEAGTPTILRQSLLMCTALSGFSAEDPRASHGDGSWIEGFRDLFKRQEDPEHTPPAYMRRLEALAARQDAELRQRTPRDAAEAVGAVDPAAFRAAHIESHACRMALAMLEDLLDGRAEGEQATGAGRAEESLLAEQAAGVFPELLAQRDAVRLLRLLELSQRDGGGSLRAAVDAGLRSATAGATLAAWTAEGAEAGPVLRLARAAGPETLAGFIAAVAAEAPSPQSRSRIALLHREELEALRVQWLAKHPAGACRLAQMLAPMPAAEAEALLGPELVQPDPARRLRGFRTLLRVADAVDEAFVLGLLDHPDAEVIRLGTRWLLADGSTGGRRLGLLLGWLRARGRQRGEAHGVVVLELAADASGHGLLHELLRPAADAPRANARAAVAAARVLLGRPGLPPALHAAAAAAARPGSLASLRSLVLGRLPHRRPSAA